MAVAIAFVLIAFVLEAACVDLLHVQLFALHTLTTISSRCALP